MKKLLAALTVLALGILTGLALEALVDDWVAVVIAVVVLCVAVWNLREQEV